MYEQSFKNQAVKECVNGQSMSATSRKYDISLSALRRWVMEYQEKMRAMSEPYAQDPLEAQHKEEIEVKESVVVLNSVNIAVDGYDITISKSDVVRLMEVFYHFDKKEGKRDDV